MARSKDEKSKDWRLLRHLQLWVDADDDEDDEEADAFFESWSDRKEKGEGVVEMSRHVLVDESVFRARFLCIPEKCSPGLGQGKWRCCCSDIFVPLTVAERRRLGNRRDELAAYLAEREPRLLRGMQKTKGRVPSFWLDEDGDALSQPNDRCVFSMWDERGRIRCHLYGFARKHRIDTSDIQPYTCRLFPLLVIRLEGGRTLVTVLNRENYKAWSTLHPRRFPCLSDPTLPPLIESMAGTFDWMFGPGFARALARTAKEKNLHPR